jgi:hypothetical protein
MKMLLSVLMAVLATSVTSLAVHEAPRRVALFFVEREEPVAADLTPAGEASVREGAKLRARFLAALRKLDGVVLVTDESAADARLEVLEASVHETTEVERTQGNGPRKPAGIGSGGTKDLDVDVATSRHAERDYALTVRVTVDAAFSDLASSPHDASAASAVDTVIRKLRGWVRGRQNSPARVPTR